MAKSAADMEKIVALCKRRGFIFQSSEIYGGIGGFWDYGPLGCELKRNIKDAWWNDMVRNPPPGPGGVEYQMVGVDCSIIMNPRVWEASGHVGGFSDPMVDDKETKQRFRADQLQSVHFRQPEDHEGLFQRLGAMYRNELYSTTIPIATIVATSASEAVSILEGNEKKMIRGFERKGPFELDEDGLTYCAPAVNRTGNEGWLDVYPVSVDTLQRLHDKIPSPFSGKAGSLTAPREFNLMFQTHVGALQDAASVAYLRPETAQGIFANFKNVLDTSRVKIPFGIAQIGKAFRNEINPRNFTFRSREFEQMEIEFFCKPDTSRSWYEFWRNVRLKWYESLGIKSDKLRPREQGPDELAHYSDACTDIEYLFPFADEPQELEGVAHRGCFDLSQHGKFAKGKDDAFAVLDEDTRERFVPHVIEPSAGVDRFALAVITEAYTFDETRASPEFMRFHPRLAPVKAAVFPLVAKDGLPEIAEPIYRAIKKEFPCRYDAKQSIGKRYARMDEAGTPFCFTIDGQTREDGTVTVRDRDDASQIRIDKSRCLEYVRDKLPLSS